jgi:microfibrillar-associated protein 1
VSKEKQAEIIDSDCVDESSDEDNSIAYQEWKARELKRLLRDREELRQHEQDKREVERRRNLTDVERQAENIRLGTDATDKKQKVAYNFMQKYYARGAFFQGDDQMTAEDRELFSRDFNMPTGEDKMDKSVLPAVLQKRKGTWGKKGNTKWTHLTDQDTTNFERTTKVPENIAFKFQMKQGGYKGMNSLDRPSSKR